MAVSSRRRVMGLELRVGLEIFVRERQSATASRAPMLSFLCQCH